MGPLCPVCPCVKTALIGIKGGKCVFQLEIIDVAVLAFTDDISSSDFLRSFYIISVDYEVRSMGIIILGK